MKSRSSAQAVTGPEDSGEPGGVAGAFVRYRARLQGYIARIVRSPHDVDDLVQETFLHVWARREGVPVTSPRAYLFRTARHVAIDTLRQKAVRLAHDESLEVPESERPTAPASEQVIEQRQELDRAMQLIGQMPPQCRKVFLLRRVEGLSHREIAVRLGLSVRTVENHIARAMRDCRSHYHES